MAHRQTDAKKTAIVSYLSTAFYIITGFFYTPYLIKVLGVSDYSIFALTTSLVGYFSLDFGIGAAQTRYIAKMLAQGRQDKVNDIIGITTKLFSIFDFIVIIILCIVYFYADDIFSGLTSEEFSKFKEVFIISMIFIMINIPLMPTNGIFLGYDRAYDLAIFSGIYRVISISALFLVLILQAGLFWVVIVNVSAQIGAQIYKFIYIKKVGKFKININSKDKELIQYLAHFSGWATIGIIADKFFFGIIPFLLAIVSDSNEIAVFAIVISVEGYILSISRSMSGIFLPRIARMLVHGASSESHTDLLIKVGRVQLYIVGILITWVICFGDVFIRLWLGPGFENSYYCLILVLVPCLFHLTQTTAEELLLASNNVKYRAITNIVGSFLSIISIVILGKYLGALAAGIGVFLSFVIAHNICIDYIYSKKLKLSMTRFFMNCHFKILPTFFVLLCFGWLLKTFIKFSSLFNLVAVSSIWVLLGIVILYFLAFNETEKIMLKDIKLIKKI